jgi:hypothetical protein
MPTAIVSAQTSVLTRTGKEYSDHCHPLGVAVATVARTAPTAPKAATVTKGFSTSFDAGDGPPMSGSLPLTTDYVQDLSAERGETGAIVVEYKSLFTP